MDKCKKCGEKFVKFPLKDEQGKFIWKNMIKIDFVSILFLIAIIFMTYSYMKDTETCRQVYEAPCEFCETTGCCQILLYDDTPEETDWLSILPSMNDSIT